MKIKNHNIEHHASEALSEAILENITGGRAGQDGNDLLIWNNGDGSDFLEGYIKIGKFVLPR